MYTQGQNIDILNFKNNGLYNALHYTCSKYNEDTAFIHWQSKNSWTQKTYGSFLKDINAVIEWLVDKSIKNQHIALLGANCYEWIVFFFGIISSGNVVVPINQNISTNEMLKFFNINDITYAISDGIILLKKSNLLPKHIFQFNELFSEAQNLYDKKDIYMSKNNIISLSESMIYSILNSTSGSTNNPKTVMISQNNIIYSALNVVEAVPIKHQMKSISALPLFHLYELVGGILYMLFYGAQICINNSMKNLAKNIKLMKPEIMLAVPSLLEAIYRLQMFDIKTNEEETLLSTLKIIFSGGAALSPSVIENYRKFDITIIQGYGLTECSPGVSFNTLEDVTTNTVGKPMNYTKVKIVNDEICVRGPNVMVGYYKNPEETVRTIKDGWLRTGDIGEFDSKGNLIIKGRLKNVIVLPNGKNVYPEELEELYKKSKNIDYCFIYAENNTIKAEVYSKNLTDDEITDIHEKVNEKLLFYQHIKELIILKEKPELTALGKVIREG